MLVVLIDDDDAVAAVVVVVRACDDDDSADVSFVPEAFATTSAELVAPAAVVLSGAVPTAAAGSRCFLRRRSAASCRSRVGTNEGLGPKRRLARFREVLADSAASSVSVAVVMVAGMSGEGSLE